MRPVRQSTMVKTNGMPHSSVGTMATLTTPVLADSMLRWRVSRAATATAGGGPHGIFGLYGPISALGTSLTLATALIGVGISFQRGTHANGRLVPNDGSGAPTLINRVASAPDQ